MLNRRHSGARRSSSLSVHALKLDASSIRGTRKGDIVSPQTPQKARFLRVLSDGGRSLLRHPSVRSAIFILGKRGTLTCCPARNGRIEKWDIVSHYPPVKDVFIQRLRFQEMPHVSGTIFYLP